MAENASIRKLLSERMLRVAALVTKGNRTADVGCDHAYTSIYLVQEGIAPSVIAMDVRKGPLERGAENVRRFHMEDKIVLRLSDGLAALCPGEADTVLLAGMGGLLMQRILSEYPETLETVQELVLQPQSEVPGVRRFLHERGFCITAEDLLFEDGKYYTVLKAEQGAQAAWDAVEYCYGRYLLDKKSPVLLEFLEQEYEKIARMAEDLGTVDTKKARDRQKELAGQLEKNRLAVQRLTGNKGLRTK